MLRYLIEMPVQACGNITSRRIADRRPADKDNVESGQVG